MPELHELVNTYKPDLIWSDGCHGPDTYWKSKEFLAWLYNDSPVKDTVVVNDRWGTEDVCLHGGYYTCKDHYNPGVLQKHKWESCQTIDKKSWGFRREANLEDFLTTEAIIATLAEVVSCGGNMLLNVGPTKYGKIAPIFKDRLKGTGTWLKVNGEAIYSSKPWTTQNDTVTPGVWYTKNNANVYGIVLHWPTGNTLELGAPNPSSSTTVKLLGYDPTFSYQKRAGGGISITIPPIPVNKMPCQWAWVFKFQGLANR